MGVYAESNIEIECDSNKNAVKVMHALIEKVASFEKPHDLNENEFSVSGLGVSHDGKTVVGFMSSGRTQNLEYQCGVLWEFIRSMEGVVEMNAPFMVEEQGAYFSNEE